MSYLHEQNKEMHPTPKTKEEQFQEWLNQCPIKITDYTDNYTDFAIDFTMEVD